MIQNTAAAIARYDREIGLALNSSRTISPTGSWDAGVKLCLVLTPEDFTAFLQKAEEEARFHRFNPHEVALQMVTSCELEFWDMVSLPGFLSWQSDSFEDQ